MNDKLQANGASSFIEAKPQSSHEDYIYDKSQPDEVQLKSQEDRLSSWRTGLRFRKAVTICTLLCIAAAADGYQINLNGNIIANAGFIRQVGIETSPGVWQLRPNATALWGALQSLGQLIAMVGLTPVSDRIGRKWTLYILWVILAASLIIETTVKTWTEWAGAKLLAGVGVGAIQSTLPIYISEFSPVNIRGTMVTAYSFWNNVGNFLAPAILYAMNDRPLEFRVPIYTQWAFLGIMLPIFIWLPETPSYFALKGYDEKGKAALHRVNGKVDGYNVEAEYALLRNTVLAEKALLEESGVINSGFVKGLKSYSECLNRKNIRRTIGGALPLTLQQLTGLSFLNTYSSLFFREAGFSNAFQITSILTGLKIACVIVFALTTDTIGRRPVVLGCSLVCVVTVGLIGGIGQIANKTDTVKNALIAMACLWSAGNVGLGALGWAYIGEVPSQKLRARAAGLSAAMSVLFGLTFNTSVPVMLQKNGANLGYNTAWVFFACGSICLVLGYFYVPETAKRNAAELDELYEKGVPCRRMKGFVTDVQRHHMEGRVEGSGL